MKKYLFSRKEIIAGIISILTGGWLFLYYIHLEETPYTRRSRYVGVTPRQLREIAESQWRQLLEVYGEHIVPVTHPDHKRVFEITKRLIMANRDETLHHMNWEVNVISSDEANAFVLPVSLSANKYTRLTLEPLHTGLILGEHFKTGSSLFRIKPL